jgi:ribosomal protein S18 acetylase RimI-like enzyme
MPGNPPIHLAPLLIQLDHPFVHEICRWQFEDDFVLRLLRDDIPQRVKFGRCRVWAYLDASRSIVGFGSIDVCTDYGNLTGKKPHPYIPLLAVNPDHQGRGYGGFIVRHLIGEAALLARQPGGACHDVVFLEAYTSSARAITLYEKCGFVKVTDAPIFDPIEQRSYFAMAKRASIATPTTS